MGHVAGTGTVAVGERQDVGHHGLPKDDERRLIQIDKATCWQLREHMVEYGVPDTDLLGSA